MSQGGPIDTTAWFVEALLATPDLLGLMHKAGVPIVAGTDGAGIELVHELEIYVQAGLSPADALMGPGRSRETTAA